MLVKPIESAPPASSRLPSRPKNTTDTTALKKAMKLVPVTGMAISHSSFSSSTTCLYEIMCTEVKLNRGNDRKDKVLGFCDLVTCEADGDLWEVKSASSSAIF